jgi:hypothetical protein
MRSKLSFDTIHEKRLKFVILMFYMHLVSAADVLIFDLTLELLFVIYTIKKYK